MKLLTLTILFVVAGCNGMACDRSPSADAHAAAAADAPAPSDAQGIASPTTARDRVPRIVFLGDSLTAGLGVDPDQAFPALIGKRLADGGVAADVVNAGVSGDTTAGGLRRLDWLLRQSPDVLVIGLGANDGLRGLSPKASADNLREIVRKAKKSGARVLLLGMMIPPNYGPEYAAAFKAIYPAIAREENVALVPFVLEGVGGDPRLNQPDGIHPTGEGHRIIATNVADYLKPLVAVSLRH